MSNRKKYIVEYRRKLKEMKHPPEKIQKNINTTEDDVLKLEEKYGFHENNKNTLSRWQEIIDTDDLPFGNPYSNLGPMF